MKPPGAKFDDDQIIEALEATRCNLAEATRFLIKKWDVPCSRNYVVRTVKKRRRLTEWVKEFRAIAIDEAEAVIFQAVENGDYQASVLVVGTLGKDRGWVPRAEKDLKLSPKDQLEAIARGRDRAKKGLDDASVENELDAISVGRPLALWNDSIQEKENDVPRA